MSRLTLLVCSIVVLAAQAAAPEVEITAEPSHHLVFENKSVRVFNVDVPAHSDTRMHWHRHDYVFVTLGASHVSNELKGKSPVDLTLPDGDTRFSPAPFAHIAHNISDQSFRNVTIELLDDDKLRAASANVHWDEERGVDILEGGTRQILFVKDGIRATEFELQPGGVVPMHRHAGPHLLVAVSDLDLREKFANDVHPGDTGHLKSGDSRWLPGNYSHSITNTGKQLAKFVTLEFP